MSEFTPQESINPWDEGDYRIYGMAMRSPSGGFWPAYSIDRIHGIPNTLVEVVARHEVRTQVFDSEELAKAMGISHGVHRVRERDGLDH
jgi:hypothetical protein